MRIYLEGVGLCGPGLDGWAASIAVLTGAQTYIPAATRIPPCDLLPANERRRAVTTVKIALAVGQEAFTTAARNPAETAAIFTSSGGDGGTIDDILTVLASPNRELSPTRFHNSVHNAPAGYWSIATGSRAASSSLCCHDDSFAAGLLEAAVQANVENCAVALIAYDVCYPAPLGLVRPIGAAFATAMIFTPAETSSSFAAIDLQLTASSAASVVAPAELEALRQNTPAARSLPLLAALAAELAADISLSYLDDMTLMLQITPLKPQQISPKGPS
jgi:hypothetical protein